VCTGTCAIRQFLDGEEDGSDASDGSSRVGEVYGAGYGFEGRVFGEPAAILAGALTMLAYDLWFTDWRRGTGHC
jgi:hypothetical protein